LAQGSCSKRGEEGEVFIPPRAMGVWIAALLSTVGALLERSWAAATAQRRVDLGLSTTAVDTCLQLDGDVCIHADGKRHTLAAKRLPEHLVAWYSFDYSAPVDESGMQHHFTSPVTPGPALFGSASVALNGSAFLEADRSPALDSPTFTVAFWLFLLEDSVGSWRTVLGKAAGLDDLTPTVLLWPQQRRLDARVALEEGEVASVASHGEIPLRRWTHVAVTCAGGVLRLYLNGLLEAEQVVASTVRVNSGPLRIGKDPWRAGSSLYLDDLRVYDADLSAPEVLSLAPTSLTGMAGKVRLGCMSCDRAAAVTACEPSRLCSLTELYVHGFHTARAQGWARSTDEFWYHNQDDMSGSTSRLALCC